MLMHVLLDARASRRAEVGAQVEALRRVHSLEDAGGLVDQFHHLGPGGRIQHLQARHMFKGQHHQMPARVGEAIERDESALSAKDDQVFGAIVLLERSAKQAFVGGGFHRRVGPDVGHAPGRPKASHQLNCNRAVDRPRGGRYARSMQQLDLFEPTPATWTVSQLNQRLRELIETQGDLQDIWIQGELSNFSRPKSGHWYFTLKDESAELRCVMWRSLAENQAHVPVDGEALEVHGAISVYEARGQYQLYADEIRPAGEGALYQEFLRLKAKLEAEGLFAAERKRPIPAQPNRIGIVTSPTGAALRDMLNTLARRYPLAEVVLAPAAVQGPAAAAELVAALQGMNDFAQPDVILLGRGGGSLEDLAAFNDEALARAIVASAAPVISGVGHETDFSISDFAADLRAPTPTAAAELATPDQLELAAGLAELQLALARGMLGRLQEQRWALAELAGRLERRSPQARIREDRQRVDDLLRRGERALRGEARVLRSQLEGRQARLAALNPAAILGRGFAVVSKGDGRVVRAAQDVDPGEELDVRVQDGRFGVRVKNEDQD